MRAARLPGTNRNTDLFPVVWYRRKENVMLKIILGAALLLTAQNVDVSGRNKINKYEIYRFSHDFATETTPEFYNGAYVDSHRVAVKSVDIARQLYIYAAPTSGSQCSVGRYMVMPTHLYVCSVDIYNQPVSGPVVGKWARIALETSW